MALSASKPPTTAREDAAVVELVRAGVAAEVIYAALWPTSPPFPLDTFREVVRAVEVAEATTAPPEELPQDLEDVVGDLLEARQKIMESIRSGGDVDSEGGFDAGAHTALVRNADVLLKYQSARQDRQAHLLNLRVAREKARIELLELYPQSKTN